MVIIKDVRIFRSAVESMVGVGDALDFACLVFSAVQPRNVERGVNGYPAVGVPQVPPAVIACNGVNFPASEIRINLVEASDDGADSHGIVVTATDE